MLTDSLVYAFENDTIDPETFGHREHLYVAWCYLQSLSLEEAVGRYVHYLRRLTRRVGAPEKYHATITWGYLVLLHGALQSPEARALEFDHFLLRHPEFLAPKGAILLAHYDQSELDSSIARERFVLPRKVADRP